MEGIDRELATAIAMRTRPLSADLIIDVAVCTIDALLSIRRNGSLTQLRQLTDVLVRLDQSFANSRSTSEDDSPLKPLTPDLSVSFLKAFDHWSQNGSGQEDIESDIRRWQPNSLAFRELMKLLVDIDAFSLFAGVISKTGTEIDTFRQTLDREGRRLGYHIWDPQPAIQGTPSRSYTAPPARPGQISHDCIARLANRIFDVPDQLIGGVSQRVFLSEYLDTLGESLRYMDMVGMGVADNLPLRLELLDLFVPLNAQLGVPQTEVTGLGGARSDSPLDTIVRTKPGVIILGDPGSGKSTFLKYLALKYARGMAQPEYLPIYLKVRDFGQALQSDPTLAFEEYLEQHLAQNGTVLPAKILKQAITKGVVHFLLDGIDEVLDQNVRGLALQKLSSFIIQSRRYGNRFALTSRIVGYREVRFSNPGLEECTILRLDDSSISDFVQRWSHSLETALRGNTPHGWNVADQESEELLHAIHGNVNVRDLARNPLLLTILALVKRQGVSLPERRAQLYHKYIETLLGTWLRQRRLLQVPGNREVDVLSTINILAPLALWMQTREIEQRAVSREAIMEQLVSIFQERGISDGAEPAAQAFLSDVSDKAGLMAELGDGQFGFLHPTFREFLAAVGLSRKGQEKVDDTVVELRRHLRESAWHEVILLTVGYVGLVQGRDAAASNIVAHLSVRNHMDWAAGSVLAGEAVADVWPGGVTSECYKAVIASSLTVMHSSSTRAPAVLRARAGKVLCRLDDTRLDVVPMNAQDLRSISFCYVPRGSFWMGSGPAGTATLGRILCHFLNYDYWISQYPVTVGQWDVLMNDSWTTSQRIEHGSLPNHPAVGHNWSEANEFCRRLNDALVDVLPDAYCIRLPSEAEWEKAARGGLQVPKEPIFQKASDRFRVLPHFSELPNVLPLRRFPWGDEFAPDYANTMETGLHTTTAVGCFVHAASPYGAEEMSGNVWEWTQSVFDPKLTYPYSIVDRRDHGDQTSAHVVRGGHHGNTNSHATCTSRVGSKSAFPTIGFRVVMAPKLV